MSAGQLCAALFTIYSTQDQSFVSARKMALKFAVANLNLKNTLFCQVCSRQLPYLDEENHTI
tara:strand:- start:1655 stop:1840 length:186 start_codon:yes stop_codon:yes gene_type:complete